MSKSNPFNLPPPWNPGHALPQNVQDEGLQRRAFTTQWAQRGTFDNPEVGTAGYAVPTYITDEKYGRGAAINAWAPRGSYPGGKIVHWLDRPPVRATSMYPIGRGAARVDFKTMDGLDLGTPVGLAIGAGIAYAAYILLRKKK